MNSLVKTKTAAAFCHVKDGCLISSLYQDPRTLRAIPGLRSEEWTRIYDSGKTVGIGCIDQVRFPASEVISLYPYCLFTHSRFDESRACDVQSVWQIDLADNSLKELFSFSLDRIPEKEAFCQLFLYRFQDKLLCRERFLKIGKEAGSITGARTRLTLRDPADGRILSASESIDENSLAKRKNGPFALTDLTVFDRNRIALYAAGQAPAQDALLLLFNEKLEPEKTLRIPAPQ